MKAEDSLAIQRFLPDGIFSADLDLAIKSMGMKDGQRDSCFFFSSPLSSFSSMLLEHRPAEQVAVV
jgi:hypothetical protein